MWEYLVSLSVIGFAITLLFFCLFAAGILIVVLARSKTPIVVFLALSFLPALVGIAGTLYGYSRVRKKAHQANNEHVMTQEEIEEGMALARRSTYFGLGATAPLVVIAGVGLCFPRDKGKKNRI